jgi:hypothetical protein
MIARVTVTATRTASRVNVIIETTVVLFHLDVAVYHIQFGTIVSLSGMDDNSIVF